MVPSQVATSGGGMSTTAAGLAQQQQQLAAAGLGPTAAATAAANGAHQIAGVSGPTAAMGVAGVQQQHMPSSAMIQHQLQQGAQVQSVMVPPQVMAQQVGVSLHAHGQLSLQGQGGGSVVQGGAPQSMGGGVVDDQLASRIDSLHLQQS